MLAEPHILMSKKTLVQILGLKVHDEFICPPKMSFVEIRKICRKFMPTN